MSDITKNLFATLEKGLKNAPDGTQLSLAVQFHPEPVGYTAPATVLHHVQLDKLEENSLVCKFSEELLSRSIPMPCESSRSLRTEDLFPRAEYIRLKDVEKRSREIAAENNYMDLTNFANVEVLKTKLKDILPMKASKTSRGLEGEVNVDFHH